MQMPAAVFMVWGRRRLYVARRSYYSCIHTDLACKTARPSCRPKTHIGRNFMNVQRLPSDFIGLSKVLPPLSRRGFMSSSAAAAAGYTLAAGPVRADAIQTGMKGLDAGMTKIKVPNGEMPAYYARPSGARHAPIVL